MRRRKSVKAVLPLVLALPLFGQAPGTSDEIITLSEFVVETTSDTYVATNSLTGTKFAAAIKDVPFNLQVVTEQLIGDMKADDLHEALNFSVGVQANVDNLGGYGKFNVRGIQQTYSLRDGFRRYGPNDTASAARVEVLKGPASLFYGHVFPGGVVNVISKRPLESRHFSLEQSYGSYGSYRTQLDFGGKLLDSLSYRIVGVNDHHRSFVDFNEKDSWTVVPSLLWRPFDRVEVIVDYEKGIREEQAPQVGLFVTNIEDYNRTKANPEDPFPIPGISDASGRDRAKLFFDEFRIKSGTPIDPSIVSYIPEDQWFLFEGPFESGPYTIPVNTIHPDLPRNFNVNGPDTFREYRFETLTGTVKIAITDWLSFRSVGGYYTNDTDHFYSPVQVTRRSGVDSWQFFFNTVHSNEVINFQTEFILDFETGFGDHKLLVGFDYVEDHFTDFRRNSPNHPETGSSSNFVRLPIATELGKEWAPLFQFQTDIVDWEPMPWGPFDPSGSVLVDIETFSEGFFLTDTMEFMDGDLMIVAGLRHDRFGQTDLIIDKESTISNTLVQGGFVYKITEEIGLFGSYTESFRYNNIAQAPSPDGSLQRGDLPPAQTGEGLEVGLKIDMLQGRFSGILTIFRATQANVAQSTEVDGQRFTVLSGEYTSEGLEVELNYAPIPSWQILFGYAYLDATQTRAAPGSILRVGDRWPNVPEHQMTLFNRFDFTEGKLDGLYVGGGARYMGSRRGGSDNNIDQVWDLTTPSYVVVDVFVGYKIPMDHYDLTLSLNIDNVFDKDYIRGGQTLPSEPRRFTGAVKVQF